MEGRPEGRQSISSTLFMRVLSRIRVNVGPDARLGRCRVEVRVRWCRSNHCGEGWETSQQPSSTRVSSATVDLDHGIHQHQEGPGAPHRGSDTDRNVESPAMCSRPSVSAPRGRRDQQQNLSRKNATLSRDERICHISSASLTRFAAISTKENWFLLFVLCGLVDRRRWRPR